MADRKHDELKVTVTEEDSIFDSDAGKVRWCYNIRCKANISCKGEALFENQLGESNWAHFTKSKTTISWFVLGWNFSSDADSGSDNNQQPLAVSDEKHDKDNTPAAENFSSR